MAKPKFEKIERCMNKKEAMQTFKNNGLQLKLTPHNKNPKWVAVYPTRKRCKQLGAAKNFSHKIVFYVKVGTLQWLKQFETKPTNEPGSFEIPVKELSNFNSRIIEMCQIVTWRRASKINKLKSC